MSDFDTLMQRYDMGQAYKTITKLMGPSHQLVAFINYDKVNENSLGLESFNVMEQHEAILAEINDDSSFKQILDLVGTAIVDLNRTGDPIGLEGLMSKLMGGKVPPYHVFQFYKKHHEFNFKLEKEYISHLPSTHTVANWKKFRDFTEVGIAKFNKESNRLANEANDAGQKSFDAKIEDSGWSKDRWESETAWIESATAAANKVKVEHDQKIAAIDKWISENGSKSEENREVAALMKATGAQGRKAERSLTYFLPHLEAMLKKVKSKLG